MILTSGYHCEINNILTGIVLLVIVFVNCTSKSLALDKLRTWCRKKKKVETCSITIISSQHNFLLSANLSTPGNNNKSHNQIIMVLIQMSSSTIITLKNSYYNKPYTITVQTCGFYFGLSCGSSCGYNCVKIYHKWTPIDL